MNILEYLQNNIVVMDGGLGSLLQERGLPVGVMPIKWNITNPNEIISAHKEYFDAGANIVCANTFGATRLNLSSSELDLTIKSALENARTARKLSSSPKEKFIALDIGPSGKMLAPFGDLDFETAVSIFSETVRLGVKYGAELIFIETMSDMYETKAAMLAAKESCDLPIFVSNSYSSSGKLMTGASPDAVCAMLEGMGANAIGLNCSLGGRQLLPTLDVYLSSTSLPTVFKPNAGLPIIDGGKTVYSETPEDFAENIKAAVSRGARIVGGCCGTTPEHIKAASDAISALKPISTDKKNATVVSSYTKAVSFDSNPVIIGERINPTGKKRLKQALIDGDIDYILGEAIRQQNAGAMVLDVNVGLPQIDEPEILKKTVFELQAVTDLPLQIDTSNIDAMKNALRIYNGKPMINSVNGKAESMDAIFPLVNKYGGVVVALTLDENGIPETAEGRLEIAKKILCRAKQYGIEKKDIVFDPLCMTVSADEKAGNVVLKSLELIRRELDANTVLGISNVSFGLPCRDIISSTFLALALQSGLTSAIINPDSAEMMKTVYAFRALRGLDKSCTDYIAFISSGEFDTPSVKSPSNRSENMPSNDNNLFSPLQNAIINGRKDASERLSLELLNTVDNPISIIQDHIIPALNEVGKGFENKTVYLPQLLMSAEAAKLAFEPIKSASDSSESRAKRFPVVLATVYGDIHDIGKNIVKLLLENYGFDVTDLGKNVPPKQICDTAKRLCAPLVGLSALMTTTVPAMEETIKLIKNELPDCKIVVGGAVLNEEYAKKIGADKYASDAMETVRYAESLE